MVTRGGTILLGGAVVSAIIAGCMNDHEMRAAAKEEAAKQPAQEAKKPPGLERLIDYGWISDSTIYSNITVRDFFAAAAIPAADHRENLGNSNEAIAARAYELADAMLAERSKQK